MEGVGGEDVWRDGVGDVDDGWDGGKTDRVEFTRDGASVLGEERSRRADLFAMLFGERDNVRWNDALLNV